MGSLSSLSLQQACCKSPSLSASFWYLVGPLTAIRISLFFLADHIPFVLCHMLNALAGNLLNSWLLQKQLDRYGSRRRYNAPFPYLIVSNMRYRCPMSHTATTADTDADADANVDVDADTGIVHAPLSSSLSMLAVSFVRRLDRPTSRATCLTGPLLWWRINAACARRIHDELGRGHADCRLCRRNLCQIHAPHAINHGQKVLPSSSACGQLLLVALGQ